MYAEEYLPQDDFYNEELGDMDISVSSEEDIDAVKMKMLSMFNKKLDTGYRKYKFHFKNNKYAVLNENEKNKMYYNVESYSTNMNCNSRIRNAITGIRMDERAGSKQETIYFSVMDTLDTSKEPRKLYYNNPEEYERHFKVFLPESVKNAWYERKIAMRSLNTV